MTPKEELSVLRERMGGITEQIATLFAERQSISRKIADVKARGNFAVNDPVRESIVVNAAIAKIDQAYQIETTSLVRTMIALSKLRQYEELGLASALDFPASSPLPDGPIAYQGVPGAWSEHAAAELFPDRTRWECEYFEDVFNAVETGRAAVGVLPIENSRTGAIGDTYDLLRRHACFVVGSVRIGVKQCLLGLPGSDLKDIREVYSHPEGFSQCKRYLKNRNWDLIDTRNTAVAAKLVADRGDNRAAAIGSRRAADEYSLSILAPDIMDDSKNATRFIAIAAQPYYDDMSNLVSVTFSVAHHSGALVETLQAFSLSGVNMTRIESRPAGTGKYRFFVDLEGNINDSAFRLAIARASAQSDYFEVLGCYSEAEEN